MSFVSRRWFLSRTAEAAVATSAIGATVATKPSQASGPFEHPAEYLAAMQAIGWRATAMYQRLDDGSVHRMGVNERAPSPEFMMEHWGRYHAISMRCPVQLPVDVHPDQHWWKAFWQYLYDKGLREDVTPPRAGDPERGAAGGRTTRSSGR